MTGHSVKIVIGVLVAAGLSADARTWSNTLGRTFEAEFVRMDGSNVIFNYGMGLLLTHYFFHMEGGKATRITQFLKGLQAGNQGEVALAPLLGGSNFEK